MLKLWSSRTQKTKFVCLRCFAKQSSFELTQFLRRSYKLDEKIMYKDCYEKTSANAAMHSEHFPCSISPFPTNLPIQRSWGVLVRPYFLKQPHGRPYSRFVPGAKRWVLLLSSSTSSVMPRNNRQAKKCDSTEQKVILKIRNTQDKQQQQIEI